MAFSDPRAAGTAGFAAGRPARALAREGEDKRAHGDGGGDSARHRTASESEDEARLTTASRTRTPVDEGGDKGMRTGTVAGAGSNADADADTDAGAAQTPPARSPTSSPGQLSPARKERVVLSLPPDEALPNGTPSVRSPVHSPASRRRGKGGSDEATEAYVNGLAAEEAMGQLPHLEGVVSKWTNYVSGWQDRFLVLRAGMLLYYRAKEEVDYGCRGSMNLRDAVFSAHEYDETRFD